MPPFSQSKYATRQASKFVLLLLGCFLVYSSTLNMEPYQIPSKSWMYQTTRRHIPENSNVRSHLKSHVRRNATKWAGSDKRPYIPA
jgi:hypothetical protein